MIIKFSDTDIKKCEKFASKIKTTFYASRGQNNPEKRKKDQIIGKIAEICAYKYLLSKQIKSEEPDFMIYDKIGGKNGKNWNCDLKSIDYEFHIKSQSIEQGAKYGISFVFENTDASIFKCIKDNAYIVFVSIDLNNKIAEIQSVMKLQDLHKNNLFGKPKLSYLTTKSVVYLDDIKNIMGGKVFAF